MQPEGSPHKYITVHEPISDEQLAAHITGEATYAAVLIDRDGKAWAWVVDFDHGGAELVRRASEALSAAGLPCIGLAVKGAGEHDGGHVWGLFGEPVEPPPARAHIKAILEAAGLPSAEVWPSGTAIRLPLGVHTWTGKRGLLIRPGLADVDLDTPAGLAVGVEAFASLEASPAPPAPAPAPRPVTEPSRKPLRAASEPRAGRVDAGEVIARFKAEHSVEELLSRYGAKRTRDGWKCNCGVAHTHDTQIYVGDGIIGFYSARCRWAPLRTDRNGRPIADAFDLYAQVEHGGDKLAALRAYNPIAPRPAEQPVEEARPAPDPATVEARRRDAARKRAARRAEAEETLQAVRDRACEDAELIAYPTARDVLRELLTLAGVKTWCRPSVAGLAARLERSERTVQRALAWLEGRYISAEKQQLPDGTVQPLGSRPGKARATAVRTFLREPAQGVVTPQTAEAGVTRHAADSTGVSPDHVHEQVHDHALERVSGGGELPAAEPAPAREPEPVAFEGGASFNPAAEPGPARDLRGLRDPHSLDNWRALCELWAERQPAAAPADDLAAELGVEEEHQVKGPPRDPVKAARYWKLCGAARKATSARQKRRLLTLAAELEEWYPAGEAPGLYLRPHAPPPPRPQLQLALGEAPTVPAPPSPAPEPSPAAAQVYGPGYALSMAERLAALRSQEVRYAAAD